MSEIGVGELLIQGLKAEGVEFMCGIIDGAHIPMVMHAPRYGIRHINCRHEEGAVHLAEGYSRLAHKPSVVIGSPGPGGANMLAGLSTRSARAIRSWPSRQPAAGSLPTRTGEARGRPQISSKWRGPLPSSAHSCASPNAWRKPCRGVPGDADRPARSGVSGNS